MGEETLKALHLKTVKREREVDADLGRDCPLYLLVKTKL